ncbi:MAG TPA: serine hydrolase [Baekduia sp.]|nr:serine hydrolase [Baekduia sp.]
MHRTIAHRRTRAALLGANAAVVLGLGLGASDALAGQYDPWVARHGLSAAQYQAEFDKWTRQGYRLTSVSGYEQQRGSESYAAIWEKRQGPAWQARHGLSAAQYQTTFNTLTRQGYRPVVVNGNSVNGRAKFAAIFEKSNVRFVARHGLTSSAYQAQFNSLTRRGYRLTHVSGYTENGAARYAAVFEQRGGPAWRAVHGQTSQQYQATFNRLAAQGFRVTKVSGTTVAGTPRYAAIFEAGGTTPWTARHGIDAAEYQATVTDQQRQGFRPLQVHAFAGPGGPRFSTVWENRAFSGADLQHIDTTVTNAMKGAGVTGLSFAIAHKGRLVFAKSYGQADAAKGTPMRTTHRMRIASLSKPFTALEVMRLVEAGRIALTDKVFGKDGLLGETFAAQKDFKDARVADITVRDLLQHTAGGWDNDGGDGTADPMFLQTDLSADKLIGWVLQNVGLEFAPGTTHQYSNFGYSVLGRIIEKVTGKSYAAAMRDDVFAPSGADSFAIGGDTLVARLPDEAAYHHAGAQTAPYTMKVGRMDAHGGWVATPVDVVRTALRVDGFATVPDLLGAGPLATMTTPTTAKMPDGSSTNYALGFDTNAEGPNWFHTGYLDGSPSILVRTGAKYGPSGSDEFVWSATANSTTAKREDNVNLDGLMWDVVKGVKAWPAHDLF